jgi:protein SCO1/2
MRSLFLAALLAALAGCGSSEPPAPPPPQFLATDITGAPWGHDFRLTDHTGKVHTVADFRGKLVAIFFGYTHCPDVCPTTLSDFAMAIRDMGAEGEKVQVLFVTVDPERDTPELLAKYVPSFNPTFLGLYTDPASLAQLAKDFKVVYQKTSVKGPTSYLIDHSAGTYVFDAQGRIRLHIAYGTGPKAIAQDLRTLLAQKQ